MTLNSWDGRPVSPRLVYRVLGIETGVACILGRALLTEPQPHPAQRNVFSHGTLFGLWVDLWGQGSISLSPHTVARFLLSVVCLSVPLASGSCLFLHVLIRAITYTEQRVLL